MWQEQRIWYEAQASSVTGALTKKERILQPIFSKSTFLPEGIFVPKMFQCVRRFAAICDRFHAIKLTGSLTVTYLGKYFLPSPITIKSHLFKPG